MPPQELLVPVEITMIRCDDIFVDSDVNQFGKICRIIRRYGFNHLIGITPFGEGKKLSDMQGFFWKIHFMTRFGFFINYRLEKLLGEKYIGNNAELLRILDTEFNKYEAIPALHGLHHYRYDNLPQNRVNKSYLQEYNRSRHSSTKGLRFPPFNAWNHNTELVCKSLNLLIDEYNTGFDRARKNSRIDKLELGATLQDDACMRPYIKG